MNETGGILVLHDSHSGHTEALADTIARAAGGSVLSLAAAPPDEAVARAGHASAIIFGTPTFMGGVTARFKAFMDASGNVWMDQPWKNRIAAGFTIGSNQSGDKLATLQHLAIFAAQHGMIWVGQDRIGDRPGSGRNINADGSWLGLMATSSPDRDHPVAPGDLETAALFGARIAAAEARWQRGKT